MLILSTERKNLFLPTRRLSSFGHQVCFFPTPSSPLLGRHCLGVLQLNSNTLPGDSFQAHKLRTHFRKTALTSDASQKSQVLTHASDQLVVDQGFPHRPPQVR